MNMLTTIEGVIKEILIHAGYGPNIEIQSYISATPPSYEFGVFRKFLIPSNITIDHKSMVAELFKQIEEPIKNSQLVAMLIEELTGKIKELNTQINELNNNISSKDNKIKELEIFKHHYDLEFKLKRGKSSDIE